MFESLESRRLLSGNVTVTATSPDISAGLITVVGDNKSNEIAITFTGTGFTITGSGGTTVNGQPALFVDSGSHSRDFNISMGNGDDSVDIGSGVYNSMTILTGNGNDSVWVHDANYDGFETPGTLSIDTGSGDDSVSIKSVHADNDLYVTTGNGDDTVSLAAISINGVTTIIGGHGNDTVIST